MGLDNWGLALLRASIRIACVSPPRFGSHPPAPKLGGWRDIHMVMRNAHLTAHLQAAVDRLVERGSQNPKVAAGA